VRGGGGRREKKFQQLIAKKRNKNVHHCGKGFWALKGVTGYVR